MPLVSYSQHFILILTYEWVQYARALHYTSLRVKHSSFLGPAISYDEDEVVSYSQHFILILTYEWVQ